MALNHCRKLTARLQKPSSSLRGGTKQAAKPWVKYLLQPRPTAHFGQILLSLTDGKGEAAINRFITKRSNQHRMKETRAINMRFKRGMVTPMCHKSLPNGLQKLDVVKCPRLPSSLQMSMAMHKVTRHVNSNIENAKPTKPFVQSLPSNFLVRCLLHVHLTRRTQAQQLLEAVGNIEQASRTGYMLAALEEDCPQACAPTQKGMATTVWGGAPVT